MQRMYNPCSGRFLCGLLFSSRIGKIALIDGENDAVLGEELKDVVDAFRNHGQQRLMLSRVQGCGVGECHQGSVFRSGGITLFAVVEFVSGRDVAQFDCSGNESLHIGLSEHYRSPHHNGLFRVHYKNLTIYIFSK